MTLLCLIGVLLICAESGQAWEESDYYDDSSERSTENLRWMSNLSDSLLLSEITIPGSHDTVSFFGGHFVQTQSWLLPEQLMAGIRFLDVRCRHFHDTLPIYHGPFYQYTYFDDVLRDTIEFLSNNPSEAILMRVKGEHIAIGNNETMFETVDRYLRMFPTERFFTDSYLPSLGESRGKIVILQDFTGPSIGLNFRTMHLENHWNVFSMFSDEIDQKWNYIVSHLLLAAAGGRGNAKLYITFTSGSGMFAFPYTVAQTINFKLLEFLVLNDAVSGNLGVIVIDFPGGVLIDKIIARNFIQITELPLP